MTDLSRILPGFPIGQYARLLPAIERQQLTTTDLLTLEVADIGRRTQLPLLDVKRLCNAVLEALHVDLGVSDKQQQQQPPPPPPQSNDGDSREDRTESSAVAAVGDKSKIKQEGHTSTLRHTLPSLAAQWCTISTLDASLDRALGGGIPTGRVTEITGESGAGKTQLLLTLLLAVQLPPSRGGLGRPALYVSTEAPLSTVRLSQILRNHPLLLRDPPEEEEEEEEEGKGKKKNRPSLDNIISTVTPDLESQDHILSFQVPVEVARRGVGLVVLDSVAANYRVEFERTAGAKGGGGGGGGGGGAGSLAQRSSELIRLGRQLHDLARQHDLAVVVSNQVADRFPSSFSPSSSFSYSTPGAAAFSTTTPAPPKSSVPAHMGGGGGGWVRQTQESPLASRSRRLPTAAAAAFSVEPTSSVPVSSAEAEIEEAEAAAVAVRSSMPEPAPERGYEPPAPPALLLDHQQRWFTGWGDDACRGSSHRHHQALKTPSLGLVWSTQVAVRIALLKRPVYGRGGGGGGGGGREEVAEDGNEDEGEGGGEAESGAVVAGLKTWRRWMKVVFAPHVPPSAVASGRDRDGDAVEFEITMGGLRSVERKGKGKDKDKAKAKGLA